MPRVRRGRVSVWVVAAAAALLASGCGGSDRVQPAGELVFSRASGGLIQTAGEVSVPRDADVFTVGTDGTSLTQVTRGPELDVQPAWSPDGRGIVFSRESVSVAHPPIASLFTVRPDDHQTVRLTHCEPPKCQGDVAPAWAPDGQTIAFVRVQASGPALMQVDAKGGGVRLLLLSSKVEPATGPAWDSAGQHLYFVGHKSGGGKNRAYVASADRGSAHPLRLCTSAGCRFQTSVALAPSGDIAFAQADGSHSTIFTAPPSGRRPKVVAECQGKQCPVQPAWAPDGRYLAFTLDTSGGFGGHLYTVQADGTGSQQVTNGASLDSSPSWRP